MAADARVAEARADFGAVLGMRLDDALVGADERSAARAADQHTAATARWLGDVAAVARHLQPPIGVRAGAMSRAWGRAVPTVRRYALIPEQVEVPAAATPDVTVQQASGLPTPMVAALVMGLPLAAVDLG